MSKLKALREKRKEQAAAMAKQRDKMNAEGYSPTAEDNATWATINGDYNATLAAIDREETVARVDGEIAEYRGQEDRIRPLDGGRDRRGRGQGAEVNDDTRTQAFGAWCRAQMDLDITEEQEEACRATRINPYRPRLDFGLMRTEQHSAVQAAMRNGPSASVLDRGLASFNATMGTQSGTAGGFLVPPLTLMRNLEINMLAYGGILQAADTITTTSGEEINWPTVDDTGNEGVLVGQGGLVAPTVGGADVGTNPVAGKVSWSAYKISSRAVVLNSEILEDAIFNLPAIIGDLCGERIGRTASRYCTLGTGNAQPRGILPAAGVGVTSLKVAAISADDLMRLEHSIDPAYRAGNGVGYMMHDAILLAIRLLKNGEGDYLFQSGANFGRPDTLNNYQLVINQSMSSTFAPGDKPILFGQLKKYKVRRVNGVRFYRLEELYRANDQDGFIAMIRMDGNLLQAGTPPVKYLLIKT